jgi:hypothetical protein
MVTHNSPLGQLDVESDCGSIGMRTPTETITFTQSSAPWGAMKDATSIDFASDGSELSPWLHSKPLRTESKRPMCGDMSSARKKLRFENCMPGATAENPIVIIDYATDDECVDHVVPLVEPKEEEFVNLFASPAPKEKKETKAGTMLAYMLANNIMSVSQFYEPSHTEALANFVVNPHFNNNVSRFCEVVRARMMTASFMPVNVGSFIPGLFILLTTLQLTALIASRGERIDYLLREIHQWTPATIKLFVRAMVGVADRKFGKQNCVYLWGKSNSGKSILLDSFVSYFSPCIGYPSNNIRSGFPLGECANSRVIRMDEIHINMDNVELYKCVMSGNVANVDKKYSSSVIIPPTPCYISSNKPIWDLCLKEKEPLLNRMAFSKFMSHTCPEDFGLLTKLDWDIIISKHYKEWKLNDVKFMDGPTYENFLRKKNNSVINNIN